MKVFQVITERHETDSDKVTEIRHFVTQENDDISAVVEHFKRYCKELEEELISIQYVLTVTQKINTPT